MVFTLSFFHYMHLQIHFSLSSASLPTEKIKFSGESAHVAVLCRRQACILHA